MAHLEEVKKLQKIAGILKENQDYGMEEAMQDETLKEIGLPINDLKGKTIQDVFKSNLSGKLYVKFGENEVYSFSGGQLGVYYKKEDPAKIKFPSAAPEKAFE